METSKISEPIILWQTSLRILLSIQLEVEPESNKVRTQKGDMLQLDVRGIMIVGDKEGVPLSALLTALLT